MQRPVACIAMLPPSASPRYCSSCKRRLPDTEFPPARLGKPPYRICKSCQQRNRNRRQRQPLADIDPPNTVTAQPTTSRRRIAEVSATAAAAAAGRSRTRRRRPSLPAAFTPASGICSVEPLDLGAMEEECEKCGAFRWMAEKGREGSCCKYGDLALEPFPEPPEFLQQLLLGILLPSHPFTIALANTNQPARA